PTRSCRAATVLRPPPMVGHRRPDRQLSAHSTSREAVGFRLSPPSRRRAMGGERAPRGFDPEDGAGDIRAGPVRRRSSFKHEASCKAVAAIALTNVRALASGCVDLAPWAREKQSAMAPPDSFPALTTRRLRLRCFATRDLADLHAFVGDPDAMRFWNSPPCRTMAETERALQWLAKTTSPYDHLAWAVCKKSNDRC